MYNNLIPGHYRYGAAPPAPPPGPLSAQHMQSSQSSHHAQQQQQQYQHQTYSHINTSQSQLSGNNIHQPRRSVQPTYSNTINSVCSSSQVSTGEYYLQVSEPDEEEDDLLVIATSDMMEDDDEQYYRPFRHDSSGISVGNSNSQHSLSGYGSKATTQRINTSTQNKEQVNVEPPTKPVDLLATLLSGPAYNSTNDDDVTTLIEAAASKSREARSMTNSLATKQTKGEASGTANESDNDRYVATAKAHTKAAFAFQKVYRALLGMDKKKSISSETTILRSNDQHRIAGTLAPSEELAKSMLVLANGHARMATSLGTMGVKWNMGNVDAFGALFSKEYGTSNDNSNSNSKEATATSSSHDSPSNNKSLLQHERLRMAVRGALDTGNHEEDITNSTFLARSTLFNNNSRNGVPKKQKAKPKGGSTDGKGGNEVNPVDDLYVS